MPTMGSLFDGIGGFPLAAIHNGITPLWASEIEPFPIEVTRLRFPDMIHVGDITKLNGADLPPVDIITGGSPCQDLSVAGTRAGLAGARSGLFMEQIRIVKEMRDADERRGRTAHAVRPRYMCWENVPGAFSSGTPKGEDFRIVLEEIVRVKDSTCSVPRPDSGTWESAGAIILGDQFSLAWRVLDAQYWGVPQRRRRIFLVADFGGRTAPEILFERESVSWNPDESRATAERNSCSPESNFGNAGRAGMERARRNGEPEPQVIASGVDCRSYNVSEGVSGTILAKRISSHFALEYRNPALDASLITTKNANVAGTLDASYYKGCGMRSGVEREVVVDAIPINDKATRFQGGGATRNQDGAGNGLGVGKPGDPSPTLTAADRHIVFAKTAIAFTERGRKDGRNCETMTDTMYALTNPGDGGRTNSRQVCYAGIVRRLTPLECERLQGYPDGWTDIGSWVDSKGKKHPESSDAARYKALGNSIAIPPWKWVLKRLCAIYERDATMASLFDGIGGFPYIWEQLNGKGSCLWASEIEPFPIAVTKYHFGEE